MESRRVARSKWLRWVVERCSGWWMRRHLARGTVTRGRQAARVPLRGIISAKIKRAGSDQWEDLGVLYDSRWTRRALRLLGMR